MGIDSEFLNILTDKAGENRVYTRRGTSTHRIGKGRGGLRGALDAGRGGRGELRRHGFRRPEALPLLPCAGYCPRGGDGEGGGLRGRGGGRPALPAGHERHTRRRRDGAHHARAARRAAAGREGRGRAPRAALSPRPGREDGDHRRQRLHQRLRPLRAQIRRHPRLCAGRGDSPRRWKRGKALRAARIRRGHRLRGHARRHNRAHAQAHG